MIFKERKEFTFVSKALSEDTFSVVTFRGVEAISKPYEFDLTLASEDPEIDLKAVLQNPATLTIFHGDEELPFHGVLAQFEQLHEVKQHVFYRAVLVPRLWSASLYHENQLFLNKAVPQIIEEILKQAGLTGLDYELKLTRGYPSWEYICQYRETDLDFISRWMEREGIYYFFEQTDQGAKMVITDSSSAHQDIKGEKMVPYSPPSGLIPSEEEIVKEFVCRQNMLPAKVVLKDYNYRKPGLEVKAEAEVDSNGRGEVYIYGEHFKDPGQGNELAKIRAEELLCRERVFCGEATAPAFSPGFIFELTGHYRDECDQRYLITEVIHGGSRAEDLLAGLGEKPAEGEEEASYTNRFVCLPADVQFRPERKTPRPKFYGTMNAIVDAAGDGQFAELDAQGRYKVILPLDLSGRSGGKASRYVRMAQPYSGFAATDGVKGPSGMHFPLHKGAEVLLTFVDGDPDRPIISSSIPNPETISPVTSENQTKSVIRDNYGNELIFDSTPGDEHIRLHSPHHNSRLELGRSWGGVTTSDHFDFKGGNTVELGLGNKLEGFVGNAFEATAGMMTEVKFGLNYELELAGKYGFHLGTDAGMHIGPECKWHIGPSIERTANDSISTAEGNSIISSEGTLNLIGAAKAEGPEGNTSILEATEEFLRLSVGNNKNPVRNSGSEDLQVQFLAGSVVTGVLAAVMAGMTALLIEKTNTVEGIALTAGPGSMMTAIEAASVIINLLYLTFVGMKAFEEEVSPVSHFDSDKDIVDSYIKLSKEGQLNLCVKEHKAQSKDKCLISLDRKKKGSVVIRAGDSRLKLEDTGNVFSDAENDLTLKTQKGNIFLNAAKGTKQVQIKCQTLYGPSKNLTVLK